MAMSTSLQRVTDALGRDIRFAVRSLRRSAGLTVFAVAIAALGIGASTTVFSISRALLTRPLPFADPGRLVWIANGTSENLSAQTVQVSNLQTLLEESRSYEDVAGFFAFYGPGDMRLTGSGEPERLTGVPVTQRFFSLLGVQPWLGRFFTDEESRDNAPRTAVLDHRFWLRRFNGDAGIVGRPIEVDGTPVTVIGVLPPGFDFGSTFTPGRRADLFTAFPLSPATNRQGNTLALIGRLRAGVRLDAAQVEATTIGSRITSGREGDAWRNAFVPRLMPLRERVSGRVRSATLVLAGAVGFLMLLVCANLSNLLLVRASGRQRELAVRSALGAGRGDLVRQVLVESLVLCAGAALAGTLFAWSGTTLISRIEGTAIPLLGNVRVDGMVLAFTVAVAVVTALAFGLLPAVQGTGFALPAALAEGSRGSTSGHAGWMRRAIVVAEVALVCVLLTAAGLLTRSLERVLDVQPGFATDDVIAVRVDPVRSQMPPAQRVAYLAQLVRTVAGAPGVERAGLTDALPLGDNFGWRRWGARPAGAPPGSNVSPLVRVIDPGYLETMGIGVRAGRNFTSADAPDAEPVIIVSASLAEVLWPGRDPIGQSLHTSGTDRRVVGVVDGVRYFGLDRPAEPEMYLPLGQPGGYNSIDLVVRGGVPTGVLIASVRSALRRADPTLPVAEVRTMGGLVDHSVFARRAVVLLVGGFAAFGLVLAALGIFAVVSHSVGERTQEIGIRMALGATPGAVRSRVLRETGTMVAVGVAVGLPISWMTAQAIRGLLFDVGATDPVTFGVVLLVLAAVALVAGYLPARRATRVDPAVALRSD